MTGFRLFLSIFGVIFIAELPDKTALAALVLATRHRPLPIFLGTAVALAFQSLVAVAAGALLGMLPARPVHMFAGGLFLVSAAVMWRKKADDEDGEAAKDAPAPSFLRSAWLAFTVVFIAEWGDLTQLATGALAARYQAPLLVFAAATLALWAVAGVAVVAGSSAAKFLDPHLTQRIAAVIFACLGVALLAGWL
jgi:putative Ca2+/H+ antiporter (TMEM165/GDT1 family)